MWVLWSTLYVLVSNFWNSQMVYDDEHWAESFDAILPASVEGTLLLCGFSKLIDWCPLNEITLLIAFPLVSHYCWSFWLGIHSFIVARILRTHQRIEVTNSLSAILYIGTEQLTSVSRPLGFEGVLPNDLSSLTRKVLVLFVTGGCYLYLKVGSCSFLFYYLAVANSQITNQQRLQRIYERQIIEKLNKQDPTSNVPLKQEEHASHSGLIQWFTPTRSVNRESLHMNVSLTWIKQNTLLSNKWHIEDQSSFFQMRLDNIKRWTRWIERPFRLWHID